MEVSASFIELSQAFAAAFIVSAMSLSGLFVISAKVTTKRSSLVPLLNLSAGGLLGGAFFHLLPESLEDVGSPMRIFSYLLAGFLFFFMIEKLLHWHHYHHGDQEHHRRLGYINLYADGLHNFLDGIAIMTSFAIEPALGIAVSVAVIMHEIPQEIGDFGVLLYAGFTKTRALFYNFLVALLALGGVFIGYWLLAVDIDAEHFLVPFTAGSFIYIAAADLIPEIHKEEGRVRSFMGFSVLLAAILIMYLLKIFFE